MAKTLIRHAKPEDVDTLLLLFASLTDQEDDFQFDAEKHRIGFLAMIENPDRCCVLVAEEKGALAGLCTMLLIFSTAMGGFVGLLENFIVKENNRGQGIGKILLETVEAWGMAHHVLRFDLQVDRDNQSAQAFYLSNGWIGTNLSSCFKYLF